MEKKLVDFVMNHFDNVERVTNEEAIKEITSNLIDRYHDLLSQGKSEEKSYLEYISSLGDIRNQLTVNKKVLSSKTESNLLFLIFFLSVISIVSFFFSSALGLAFLLISVILFSYLYLYIYKQTKQGLNNDNAHLLMEKLLSLTKMIFPLLIMWVVSASLLILETLLILFSNLDKLEFQMFYQSTPIGAFFIMWLIVFLLTFVCIFNNYAIAIKHYQSITKSKRSMFPFQRLIDKIKCKKYSDYSTHKKSVYLNYIFLSSLHVLVTLFSEIRKYYKGPVLLENGNQEIRTILIDSSPLWKKFLENANNIGFILLVIILVTGIIIFTLSLKYKPLFLTKIFLSYNIAWNIGILITAFSFMFYTGVIHDFSTVIYYSLGVIAIQITFLILNRKSEELLYE